MKQEANNALLKAARLVRNLLTKWDADAGLCPSSIFLWREWRHATLYAAWLAQLAAALSFFCERVMTEFPQEQKRQWRLNSSAPSIDSIHSPRKGSKKFFNAKPTAGPRKALKLLLHHCEFVAGVSWLIKGPGGTKCNHSVDCYVRYRSSNPEPGPATYVARPLRKQQTTWIIFIGHLVSYPHLRTLREGVSDWLEIQIGNTLKYSNKFTKSEPNLPLNWAISGHGANFLWKFDAKSTFNHNRANRENGRKWSQF